MKCLSLVYLPIPVNMEKLLIRLQLLFILTMLLPVIAKSQVPAASFYADVTNGCTPLVVRFGDQSTNNPTSWKWDLGNGTLSNLRDPVTSYFLPGVYTIKLTVTNAAGKDSIVKTNYITVYATPASNFHTPDTLGCIPYASRFTDLSTSSSGTIVKWEWNFGDGTISPQQHPTHLYTSPGNQSVFLKVTNDKGCNSSLYKTAYVKLRGVAANFSYSITPYCNLPVNVSFNNSSNGAGNIYYTWDFGDGQTSALSNPSHTYGAIGNYLVTLIAKTDSGCSDTVTKTISIYSQQTQFLSPAAMCIGIADTFRVTSTPTPVFVRWNMGDGTTYNNRVVSHTYNAAGTYTVKLFNDFGGCTDSTTKTIMVTKPPVIDFSAPVTQSCQVPFTVNFTDQSSPLKQWLWDFGDGGTSTQQSPTYTFTKKGIFTVKLSGNSANCTATHTKADYVKIRPAELFIYNLPANGCAPFTFSPNASITSVDGFVSYHWDFGDGYTTTSSSPTLPTHTYTTPGVYSIRLVTVSKSGCTDSLVYPNSVQVGEHVKFDFSVASNITCAKQPLQFTSTVTASPVSYYWQFGDSGTASVPHPLYQYKDTGLFNVALSINYYGCITILEKPDFVRSVGTVSKFTFIKDCTEKGKVSFANTSISAASNLWDFGDGTTSTNASPVHLYIKDGVYKIRLITSNSGCSDTSYQTIPVWLAKADVTTNRTILCKGESVVMNMVHPNPAYVVSYNWSFDGTNYFTTPTAAYGRNFNQSGTYQFYGYTVDSFGCKDDMVKVNFIRVNGPTAKFAADVPNACLGNDINFLDSSTTDGVNPIAYWIWDFGDGNTKTDFAPPFKHTYNAEGVYSVKLKTIDQSGCWDSIIHKNYITTSYGAANFEASDSLICTPTQISFNNLSTGNIISYAWDFGNGVTSAFKNPIYNYADTGMFTVKLTITAGTGCVSTMTKAGYINYKKPVARFSASDSTSVCAPLQVKFVNNSYFAQKWQWSFGDGTYSVIPSPQKVYSSPGVFTTKLFVTSAGGCIDSAFQVISVAGPVGTLSYSPISGCVPLTVNFRVRAKDAANFTWDYDDGVLMDLKDSVSTHVYVSRDKYLPRVLLQDSAGCVVPIVGKDTIFAEQLQALFSSDVIQLCDSGDVAFTNRSISLSGGLTYLWTFGDGGTSTQKDPVHRYGRPGNYKVLLKAFGPLGCSDTVGAVVNIKVVPSPSVTIDFGRVACANTLVTFNAVIAPDTSAIVQWSWKFGNGQTSTTQNPPPQIFSTTGMLANSLTVTNAHGCSSSVNQNVNVQPLPVLQISKETTICLGRSTPIFVSGASTYNWTTSAPGLSCYNCSTPIASPVGGQRYNVTGTSAVGCNNYDSVLVRVQQPVRVSFTQPDQNICIGKTVQLIAQGAQLYTWSPAGSLSATNIQNPIASPIVTTNYKVIGSDTLGCFTDTAFIKVNVFNPPTVQLGADITLSFGSTYRFNPIVSSDVNRYLWIPFKDLDCTSCANPTLSARDNTDIILKVSNPGCSSYDTLRVVVLCDDKSVVFIPNTFSPNADGMNDVFYIRGKATQVQSLQVFNRWGEMVFDRKGIVANNPSDGWNGTYKGNKCAEGVFIYIANIVCSNGQTVKYTGNVTLIQ